MKKIQWRWDYGVYMCFCPYCDEPAYENGKCVFCGKQYKWIEPKYKPTKVQVGDYAVVQATNNNIAIYDKDGQMLYHAQCPKKMTEEELVKQVDYLKKMQEKYKKEKNNETT
jgi:hypothetical protein